MDRKSCGDFEFMLKIVQEDARATRGCRVRQGGNLALTLFATVVCLTAEDIMKSLERADIEEPKIRCDPNENGVLRSHNKEDLMDMFESEINLLTHADDRGRLLNESESIIRGSRVTCEVMAKWGLVAHSGNADKKTKY